MKVRQNLYIDQSLSDALEALALRPGGNKSRIVNEALGVWLARRATKEVDDLLKPRLDRISREVGACRRDVRSEEHTSELQSLMRISYAVFCLKKKKNKNHYNIVRHA